MGVNVVEAEEDAAEREGGEVAVREETAVAETDQGEAPTTAPTIRCACTCARWARWSCCRREGEIAIAKRIEAGRDTMIRGLCESALTFEAIMVWREELGPGRILLREVIDLEQTYGGQVAQALSRRGRGRRGRSRPSRAARDRGRRGRRRAAAGRGDDDDDFDDGAGPTVSAMEGELREGVMATLDAIAGEFEAFRRLQEKLVEHRLQRRGPDRGRPQGL